MNITKKPGKKEYPSKKTLNLAVKEKSELDPSRSVPAVALVLVLALLFGKFAVADRLETMYEAQARVAQAKQEVDDLNLYLEDYGKVAAEYARYSVGWMTHDEKYQVLRTDMIKLIDKELFKKGSVSRISMNGNIISAELSGINLEETSKLVDTLGKRSDVDAVSVYTASSETGENAVVSIVITMKGRDEEVEQ